MASTSLKPLDFSPEPDLYPLYPTLIHISHFLAAHTGLTPLQKSHLVAHCLSRVCIFADISVLQYLLSDPQAQVHVDLSITDDDGMGLISLAIQGFRADSDRDIEREECVRLLVAQGADMAADKGTFFFVSSSIEFESSFQLAGHLCTMLHSLLLRP